MAKDPRKKAKYNLISRIFFCWIEPLFWLGCKRSLEFNDLYVHPPETDSSYLLEKFNKYWKVELQRKKNGMSPRLLLAWFKCFWWRVLLHGLFLLGEVSGFVCQSELIGSLAEYFVLTSPSKVETRNAYLYALGLALLSIFLVFIHAIAFYYGFLTGLQTRVVFTSAIYQKILNLSQITIGKQTVGHIVNLASNDVHKFDIGLLLYHYVWIAPVHVIVVTYLLYREVQWSAFVATALLVLQVPLQLILAFIFGKIRLKAARLTDKRVKIMNEVISGIRVIKMYAWEYAFTHVISNIRRREIFFTLKYMLIRALNYSYATIAVSLVMFLVFTTYLLSSADAQITPRRVFVSLSLITYIRVTSIHILLVSVQTLSDLKVSWQRIKNFLLLEELEESQKVQSTDCKGDNKGDYQLQLVLSSNYSDSVIVQGLTASWSMDSNKLILSNISFTVNKEKPLLAVVGAVGSGKSTLLQCLLKELPALSGTVTINGSVGYASQEAWIFSATLRENILFGLAYDPDRYDTVIEACALKKDIEVLPEGDLTLVGERGVTLSGGQKARVNLARAVYRQADVYLLDDPLSAVDATVSRHLFERCIRGLLSDKIVILVTHQIQYLEQCDAILGLNDGGVLVHDNAMDILKEDSGIFELLADEGSESNDDFNVRKQSITYAGLEEQVTFSGTLERVTEEDIIEDDSNTQTQEAHATEQKPSMDTEVIVRNVSVAEERAHGIVSMKTYFHYFIAGGGYIFTSVVVIMLLLAEVNLVFTDWWISDWADCESDTNLNRSTCSLNDDQRIGVYGGLVGLLVISGTLRTILFFILLINAARVVHNRMFAKVLRAPVRFFDTNPIGRVLNRFSKDIGYLDDQIVWNFMEFLSLSLHFSAIMITAFVANPYVLIAVTAMVVFSLVFRWYYLKTSRDVKRLEALARSPIYSHLSLTLQGLPTIRSYSMQNKAMNLFYMFHNQHSQAAYLYIVTNRWFGMRIDIVSSLFISIVAFSSIPLSASLNASLVGLALTYVISLNGLFQYCVRVSAEVESLMVSAERVMAYGSLETESSLESDPSVTLGSDWPAQGHIELNNLSYRHSNEGPLVLKGISCDIKPSEKIGVVGRTGAGKSSLIAALFRLAEPTGSIKIDGVEITQLGLHDVRSKMSIIPQDPVLFGASVRYNLDPFNQYDDDKIWRALDQVQLKNVVEVLEGRLESAVSEGGGNFSVGQKQLFCLARALLQNNSILILDEATANVDMETDAIIQQVIREQFSDCTILTIAHRLDTVMDSDRIMALRAGKLIEFDVPHMLLSQSSSYLSKLVEQTGSNNAQKLRSIALESYNSKFHV